MDRQSSRRGDENVETDVCVDDQNRIKRREEKKKIQSLEGRPACKPPFKTNCIVEKKATNPNPK